MSPTSTSASSQHVTWSLSYSDRAALPDTSPLAAYILNLMALKRTNLCVSADVTTTSELLTLADEIGDSICLLKTHCDIITDFGERTVRGLRAIARRKRFLIFEDRKFADVGHTVKQQYCAGPFRIARWAEITNAHILPGPDIITALKEGADAAIAAHHAAVHTEISADPQAAADYSDNEGTAGGDGEKTRGANSSVESFIDRLGAADPERKRSIVSISTTIHTSTENINNSRPGAEFADDPLVRLGDAPIQRSLLLLAEMSSKGHLLTGAYTEQCITLAREHRNFVMGFIAQRSLNIEHGDNFITMTPGCQLPPPGVEEGTKLGDDLGQQYNTPKKLILEQGCDIVIVGRGIYKVEHRALEAERYRREAWEAYEQRIQQNE